MSHLEYYTYPGVGVNNANNYHYSQAVRVGDTIQCAGQGGWDRETGNIQRDIAIQIDQAFENCEFALRGAGGTGFEQVYRVNSYHIPLDDEALEAMTRNLRKYMPNHKPIWTCVGVPKLGRVDMQVEIEVWAHVGK